MAREHNPDRIELDHDPLATFEIAKGTPAMTRFDTMQWPMLLVGATVIGSTALACVVPFAAFAAIAARTLTMRSAIITVGALWLINQALGFTAMGYPWTVNSLEWGLIIGAAALCATGAAGAVAHHVTRHHVSRWNGFIALAAALTAAFGVYEGGLYLGSVALGGAEIYTAEFIGYVTTLSIAWAAGLQIIVLLWGYAVSSGWVAPGGMAAREP